MVTKRSSVRHVAKVMFDLVDGWGVTQTLDQTLSHPPRATGSDAGTVSESGTEGRARFGAYLSPALFQPVSLARSRVRPQAFSRADRA